jgi:hypothetical protein
LICFVGLIFVAGCFATHSVADELTETEFRKIQNDVRISTNEPWRQIPWTISLLGAQHKAAENQQPIFIWAMDGHPLGCT